MMTLLSRAVLFTLLFMLLVSCGGAPEYAPDAATVATREAAEYQTRQDRGDLAWKVVLGFAIVVLVLLVILAALLGSTRYRIAAADAKKAENEARRLELVSLGDGKAYDLRENKIITTGAKQPDTMRPVMPAQPVQVMSDNKYLAFLQRAAHAHPEQWRGRTIPRFERMGMSGAEWTAITNKLVEEELIEKTQTGTTILEMDLGQLYNLLLTSPITE